ncbi:MAG: response regulator transcription factor [Caldilineaceae bacterium]
MAYKHKLFLIDPYSIVRSGLRMLLANEPDMLWVGEAATGAEALQVLNQVQPDVVVMEVLYPHEDGLDLLRCLRRRHPSCHVLVFTDDTDDRTIYRAMHAGALGYLPKDVPSAEIIRAVRTVAQGEPALHAVAQRVLLQLARGAPSPLSALTTREQEILRLITQGKRNRDIANQLCLTEGTVKGYVSAILTKLDVADRTQAAMFAVKHRLVPSW